MKYINVYLDNRGLWTASLCRGSNEVKNLGGSYSGARSAKIDAMITWGRDLDVKISYNPVFLSDGARGDVIRLISSGMASEDVAKELRLRPAQVRAIKAHITMGTYRDTV